MSSKNDLDAITSDKSESRGKRNDQRCKLVGNEPSARLEAVRSIATKSQRVATVIRSNVARRESTFLLRHVDDFASHAGG